MDNKVFPDKHLCLVMGNGPSLKGFDFFRAKDCHTLGMNAAYRYWDRIGWYPDHYCCLDDQLIETHHDEIVRLYKDGHIKTFFLHHNFFKLHPDLLHNPDFFSLDQFLPHREKQCNQLGMECYFDHPAFAGTDTTKVTTGAYAVRFIAFRGYSKIALLGIDLMYEEILPEAKHGEGYGLIMEKTPDKNPNYFFDDYQRSGDKYNIPNPSVHNGELHPKSFELIRDDFKRNKVSTIVVNSNSQSVLYQRRVFPFEAINIVLSESLLGAVFVPTRIEEKERILQNFSLWAQDDYLPSTENGAAKCDLVFVFNNHGACEIEEEVKQAFVAHKMERFFKELKFIYLNLVAENDKYCSDYTKAVGPEGYKAGPNNQFFQTMSELKNKYFYAFLMETDCVPIRPNWLSKLESICNNYPPFWLLGSAYRGSSKLAKDFLQHINGNAVYAVGDPQFQEFVRDTWFHYTKKLVSEKNSTYAYDCILEVLFSDKDLQGTELWKIWQQSAHKFHYTDYIQNISGKDDADMIDANWLEAIKHEDLHTYIIHSKKALDVTLQNTEFKLTAAEIHEAQEKGSLSSEETKDAFPKVLIIDMTPIGDGTATGELKNNLLSSWPGDSLCQVYRHGLDKVGYMKFSDRSSQLFSERELSELENTITDFSPDVILYRPTPRTKLLHTVAMFLIQKLNKPLVTWIMDDWPEDLRTSDSDEYKVLNADLRSLFSVSACNFSISPKMSEAFEKRYGVKFVPLANGVNLDDWSSTKTIDSDCFRIRYCGSLASNMVLNSVIKIARAVDTVAHKKKAVFEINTSPIWECMGEHFEEFNATSFNVKKNSQDEYRKWLQDSDLCLIAYNFDEGSLIYTQYSLANKLPECLASGSPVLAFGPLQSYSIEYLKESGCAAVVDEDSEAVLAAEITRLIDDKEYREGLVTKAKEVLFENHNLIKKQELLRKCISDASTSAPVPAKIDSETSLITSDDPVHTTSRFMIAIKFAANFVRRVRNKLLSVYNIYIAVRLRSLFAQT